ncbi:CHASE3 domain-containing protein [Mesorhizobium sp. CAU 1741]|uniref:sensor histidine kinase n=1 Tax=Mesorhizobium sp. CAU 1741 TaxID=3140366 RepID=UPI00325BA9E2
MPITQTSFMRTSAILLIVGLVALIAIVGTTLWLVERTQVYFDEVVEAREARAAVVDLRYVMQDAEIGQRGYLLTLDEPYLDPFNESAARIIPSYERLARILEPYPQATEPMRQLREGIDLKLSEMKETIRLAREGRRDEAIAIVSTDRGKEIMDQARLLFDGVINAADRRLNEGVEDQRASAVLLRWTAILGGLVIISVVGGSVWTAVTYTREILSARSEVEALNAGLEARVSERTQDLMRANEEVQRFAYIVTHDLRAPLVNIMGFTSELDETMKSIQAYVLSDGDPLSPQEIQEARVAASEDLPEAIGFIRSSTRKMDGLINAILKISRDGKRPVKPETIDLKSLLETNLASVQHQVTDADGETSLSIDVPTIVSDRFSLEQIVGNLLDNAVKYRATDRPLEIAISVKKAAGRQLRIDITDNGRGIAAEDHQRVFDLFRRAGQQDQPGEGIGLAHVRTLARSLGGDITMNSILGEGTTFSVILPLDVRTVTRSTIT